MARQHSLANDRFLARGQKNGTARLLSWRFRFARRRCCWIPSSIRPEQGDSFAGGFFGYLASQPEITLSAFKRAMFYGGVMGSFACEKFGTERLQQLSREEIDQRFSRLRELSHLD